MRRPKIIIPATLTDDGVVDNKLQVRVNIDAAAVDPESLAAYRRHWWQIWKPMLRHEDTEIRFGRTV